MFMTLGGMGGSKFRNMCLSFSDWCNAKNSL